MPDIHGRFIRPLIALYGEIGTDDADLVFRVYEEQLKGYPDVVLDAAFKHVAGTHMPSKRNPWPSPAACKRACEKALHEKQIKEPPAPEKPRYPEWSHEAIRFADDLVMCDMGQRAAREGWVLGLHDFCRNKRRLPHDGETHEIIKNSRFIDRVSAGAEDAGFAKHSIAKLANSMLAKREKLAKRVLGESA